MTPTENRFSRSFLYGRILEGEFLAAASIGIIIILGLLVNSLFAKRKLPGFLGMLILGIVIGPHGFNWLTTELLDVSADFRRIVLFFQKF